MKPRVYIETTIPSFYHEVRSEPEMVARRAWTREWWDNHRSPYVPVTSIAVIEELEAGNHPARQECLELLSSLPLLPVTEEVAGIVEGVRPAPRHAEESSRGCASLGVGLVP
jgi:hypothetical protein